MNAPAAPAVITDRKRKPYTWHGLTLRERFERKINKTEGCWLWAAAVNANGYGSFCVGNKLKTASRVAYEVFVGAIPTGQFVLHRCDNPLCVRPEHLFLGTHQENMRDRNAKGRARGARGESNTKAKLDQQKADAIRASDLPTADLVRIYLVDASTIQRIRSGKLWRSA